MLDAYFAAGCVGLLIALAVTVSIIRHQRNRIGYLLSENAVLLSDLQHASKNDHRDASGRFTRA